MQTKVVDIMEGGPEAFEKKETIYISFGKSKINEQKKS